ncbi:MAG: AraC family transcriptional regulator [Chitinophagaceae bacterium]|nr:MAG: AraC family transcriptional regulator [Chitinophagaceae bacterium]
MTDTTSAYRDFRIAVPAAFEEVFSHFYFAGNQSAETVSKMLLPSYQTILIFSFGTAPFLFTSEATKIEVDKCMLIGPVKRAFNYGLPPGAEILTVNFKDDAFYRFFGNACIAEHVPVEPDDLLKDGCFHLLWNELNKVNSASERVERLLQFSKPYLSSRNKIAAQLAGFKDANLNPIKAVAIGNSQTERNTQLTYKKHFGYSAKELNRYERFFKAIGILQEISASTSKVDWFEIIDECGYYDQSQLIHDFKHFINLSPSRYLAFQQDICNPVT